MIRDLSTPPAVPSGSLARRAQPTLPAGGGLLLRPWRDADAPVFLAAYADAETRRWHTRRPADEGRVRAWFARYRKDWQRERAAHWAVTRDGTEVLGRIALGGLDFDDGLAGVGYWVLPAARGQGAATRALAAVTAWALDEVGFERLTLEHSTGNPASCRVAVKGGYRLEGTLRSAARHDDGRHDMHLHARVRGDRAGL